MNENSFEKLAYHLWSIHPKDIPNDPEMPQGFKGGQRAWYYAQQIKKLFKELS